MCNSQLMCPPGLSGTDLILSALTVGYQTIGSVDDSVQPISSAGDSTQFSTGKGSDTGEMPYRLRGLGSS